MEKKPYRPISCDFHSELELLCLRCEVCEIVYRCANGGIRTLHSPIADLYTRSSEEFLLLPGNLEIRLGRLIRVNNFRLKDYCS